MPSIAFVIGSQTPPAPATGSGVVEKSVAEPLCDHRHHRPAGRSLIIDAEINSRPAAGGRGEGRARVDGLVVGHGRRALGDARGGIELVEAVPIQCRDPEVAGSTEWDYKRWPSFQSTDQTGIPVAAFKAKSLPDSLPMKYKRFLQRGDVVAWGGAGIPARRCSPLSNARPAATRWRRRWPGPRDTPVEPAVRTKPGPEEGREHCSRRAQATLVP